MQKIKNDFFEILLIFSKMELLQNLSSFIQGEDAFLLKLYLNEKLNPKKLSEDLNITKGRVTAIINSLINKNYVEKLIKQTDKRSFDCLLTENGYSYIHNKLMDLDHYFEALFNHIGYDDSKQLVEVLSKVLQKVHTFEVK
ncbi:MarR family winged helix-turn-helix transcriptional regulator [Acholeplasma granularum]|uniref:MarR family winged helix-turn-helix transcriptional regulator n=1 Tax=Acholeplasma granularum TaxID=264635 RepID=UPI000471521C|nr:helix-turn-helix domain-containing protein [Acholeplasma granularum]